MKLESNFYSILAYDERPEGAVVRLKLNGEHEIYRAHFPGSYCCEELRTLNFYRYSHPKTNQCSRSAIKPISAKTEYGNIPSRPTYRTKTRPMPNSP